MGKHAHNVGLAVSFLWAAGYRSGSKIGECPAASAGGCGGSHATAPPAGLFGELAGNITGLLATEKNNTTPFTLENDTAPEFYVTGKPAPDAPQVRKLEQDVGGLTAANPYTGTTQDITNYLAGPTEEAILHIVNADPARTLKEGAEIIVRMAQIGPRRPHRRLLQPPRPRSLVVRPDRRAPGRL